MKKQVVYIAGLALVAGCVSGHRSTQLTPALQRDSVKLAQLQEEYSDDIYPFFEEYCFSCHGDRRSKGEVNLEALTNLTGIGEHPEMWDRVLDMLDSGQMPPKNKRQPDKDDREEIATFIATELDTATRAMRPEPGHITAQRLNREEYNNTIRDLLGVDTNPSGVFPVDDSGYGFDNIGDVLTVSPILMEKYFDAAEEIVDDAMAHQGDTQGDNSYLQIFQCGHKESSAHTRGCVEQSLDVFLPRAYRRPVSKNEVRKLMKLVELAATEGDDVEFGMKLALQAALVSPHFLFRIEQDQKLNGTDSVRYVNDYELASRLSYFLWSSMPDKKLLSLASKDVLHDPEVLNVQIKRMIADEKADAFIENFAGQWLELRNLEVVSREKKFNPDWSMALRKAMGKESELFFASVLRDDESILNFLDSDYTFVNEVLAKHYGIEGVTGEEHQRVSLDGVQRGGVLTQASVLTITSRPRRTSPVLRGAWIMENILGAEPPPPPPDIPALQENTKKFKGTFREQLERHRDNASCASCHNRMDPLGFAFEGYSPIGKWRAEERGMPIDSRGVLPSGEMFEGSQELRAILLANPDDFTRCFTEKVLTYALGRGVEEYDRPVVAGITERLAQNEYRFQQLIQEIVLSVPFQIRREDGAEKKL